MTDQGRTPLRVALLDGSLDIAGLLLDNGADIDYVDTDTRWGQPPIQLSRESCYTMLSICRTDPLNVFVIKCFKKL